MRPLLPERKRIDKQILREYAEWINWIVYARQREIMQS